MKKFRAVQGILYRQFELKDWKEDQFVSFFEVYNYFMEEDTCKVTNDKLKALEKDVLEDNYHPIKAEILFRIDQFVKDPKSSPLAFYRKLANMTRVIGGYCKKNPSVVTEKVNDLVKDNPRLNWMTELYRVATTSVGDVVVPHTMETTGYSQKPIKGVDDPRVKIAETYARAADIALNLVTSITKKDIRSLKSSEKFTALAKLLPLIKEMKGYNPNIGTFNQLNINVKDKEDMERALLDLVNK